jgi:hypothetical protein
MQDCASHLPTRQDLRSGRAISSAQLIVASTYLPHPFSDAALSIMGEIRVQLCTESAKGGEYETAIEGGHDSRESLSMTILNVY